MGIEEVVTAPRSPWQNPFVERLIGSIRRECLDHVIVWNETSLRRTLRSTRSPVLNGSLVMQYSPSLLRFSVVLSTGAVSRCRHRRTGQCNGTRLRLRRSPVEAMTRRWPSQSRKGRDGSFLRTVEQCFYAVSQGFGVQRSLKKGALAGHGLSVSQFTWGRIAEKKSAYLRANELKPSEEFAKAVTVQNSIRQYEVDRSLVLAADAPSLASAIDFQHRVAKGTQAHGQGH